MATFTPDQDLDDWLELTNWHEEAFRTNELAHYRDLKAIEAEEKALAARKAQLLHRYQGKRHGEKDYVMSSVEPPTPPEQALLNTPSSSDRYDNPPAHIGTKFTPGPAELSMSPREDTNRPSRTIESPRNQCRSRIRSRSRSPLDLTSRVIRPARSNGDLFERREYRDDRQSQDRLSPDLQRLRDPNIRYFTIKSYDGRNIEECHRDGIWATTIVNGDILTQAFNECEKVILFFSANGSRAYQGYARMKSVPSPDNPRPNWYRRTNKFGEPFEVEWITKNTYPSDCLRGIKNKLSKETDFATRSRDGQEMDSACGQMMIERFFREDRA